MRGQACSISGGNYEKQIHEVLKKCFINNKPFHTQLENQLGGSSSKNDIVCNFNSANNIAIEVKKCNTPDWMQCSLRYNKINNQWSASNMGKNPVETHNIYNNQKDLLVIIIIVADCNHLVIINNLKQR